MNKLLIEKFKKVPTSYLIANILTIVLLVTCITDPVTFTNSIDYLNKAIFDIFGNFYLWFVYATLIGLILIGISPLGQIKIGGLASKPKYSMFSWLSMLFCAGVGVTLLFWGGAEPLFHYMNPYLVGADTDVQKQIDAFQIVFFHWGLHPWGIYGFTTLAICFFSMNLKRGIFFSSFLLTKDDKNSKIRRILKGFINNFTIIAILFGIVTSFGLGVVQVEGGLQTLFNIPPSFAVKLGIIAVITVCYMFSTLRGLSKGIKVLSNVSMIFSFILLICIAIALPVETLIIPLTKSLPTYLMNISNLSLGNMPFVDSNFLNDWTIKYWAWWIAWAPFVGIFISLISKGRTVRQIVFSMLLIPSVFSVFWFAIMGETAIYLQKTQHFIGQSLNYDNVNIILYRICDCLFTSPFMGWFSLMLVALFFINSADSATYTLAAISQDPKTAIKITKDDIEIKTPPVYLQICWGLTFSVLAGLFLFVGNLQIIEKTMLITVLPFTFMLGLVFIKLVFEMIKYYKKYHIFTNVYENRKIKTIKDKSINPEKSKDNPSKKYVNKIK